jgi:hypothetical protein
MACNSSINQMFTLDSDKSFLVNMLSSSDCIKSNLNKGRITAIHVDIGETGPYGHPIDLSHSSDYHLYPQQILKLKGIPPDLVLVDGRFRVACVLYSLLAIRDNGHILIHDFFQRPEYYIVLEYAEVVDCIDSMIMLKKRHDINWTGLMTDIFIYLNKTN